MVLESSAVCGAEDRHTTTGTLLSLLLLLRHLLLLPVLPTTATDTATG